MNYYIEKDNKIIFVDTDLQRLQNSIIGQDLTILETERPIENFEFTDTPEYIAEKKVIKKNDAETKAYKAIDEKYITYNDGIFKSNKETQNDLTATGLQFLSGAITVKHWVTSDNVKMDLYADDIGAIGQLIGEIVDNIWNKNSDYINAIDSATNLAELTAIEIEY